VPGLGVPDAHLGTTYPNPIDPPSGCPFHPRCPQVMPHCSNAAPLPLIVGDGGRVKCHLYAAWRMTSTDVELHASELV
jgi:peptide/nickel transport system ATP-binding protein